MKDSRRTRTEILKRLVRTACIPIVAACATPALGYQIWIETHLAATYPYVLGKGQAAGRSALLAAGDPKDPAAAKSKNRVRQGANRLAQCPGCAGESPIAPPRGTH